MKGRIFGVMAAVSLGLTSLASAAGLELSSISPPGAGLPGGDARLFAGPQGSLFGGTAATSGNAANLDAGDLASLVGMATGNSSTAANGQIYVFSLHDSINEGSMVILAGGSLHDTSFRADTGEGVFQTGGVTISALVGGGFSSADGLNTAASGWSAFVYDDMDIWTGGNMTMYGVSDNDPTTIALDATVNFLSWNSDTSTFDVATSSNMDGSLSFAFQVVPVPAPALLAGVGLLGAGVVRRRMKN